METGLAPRESAADGLAVLEIMLAAYHSAFTGRKVSPHEHNFEILSDMLGYDADQIANLVIAGVLE